MKERPILFSAPMVRAILEGKKTQTRRVLKAQPHPNIESKFPFTRMRGEWVNWHEHADRDIPMYLYTCKCPYGKPGDRLWVRETFLHTKAEYEYSVSTSVPYLPEETIYAADVVGGVKGCGFTPSIFMPRRLSRITLEITEVRVQRLQEISEQDAVDEGIQRNFGERGTGFISADDEPTYAFAASAFLDLWISINGVNLWVDNPWVWAITFKRVQP